MDPSNSSERSRSMGRNSRLFFCSAAICSTQKCSQLMLVLFILHRTGYFHTGIGKLNVSGDYPAELPVRRQMSNTVKLDIKTALKLPAPQWEACVMSHWAHVGIKNVTVWKIHSKQEGVSTLQHLLNPTEFFQVLKMHFRWNKYYCGYKLKRPTVKKCPQMIFLTPSGVHMQKQQFSSPNLHTYTHFFKV